MGMALVLLGLLVWAVVAVAVAVWALRARRAAAAATIDLTEPAPYAERVDRPHDRVDAEPEQGDRTA